MSRQSSFHFLTGPWSGNIDLPNWCQIELVDVERFPLSPLEFVTDTQLEGPCTPRANADDSVTAQYTQNSD